MQHYYAVAERDADGGFGITFPDRDGITAWAENVAELVSQAQDALESVAMYGGKLPLSTEEGAKPPDDLSDFDQPAIVVVIPFEPAVSKAAA